MNSYFFPESLKGKICLINDFQGFKFFHNNNIKDWSDYFNWQELSESQKIKAKTAMS